MLTPYGRDSLSIQLELVGDWTGWTFKSDIRSSRSHLSALIDSFNVDASQANIGIVLFELDANEMQALTVNQNWWYDLRAELGTAEVTFIQEQISLQGNVTP